MITLDQAIQDIIELNRQDNIAFSKRQDKLRLMWSEANDNLSPNIDCNGRFHAPCSGYCLPTNEDYSTTLNKGEEFYFEKGQYMPTHREYTRKFTGVMVEGKRTVRGTVKNIGCSVFHGNRFKSVTQKITVELDDNTTCYGSVPSNVNVAIGDRVEFTATFSKSDTIHHGWYKRPSKFTIGVRNAY